MGRLSQAVAVTAILTALVTGCSDTEKKEGLPNPSETNPSVSETASPTPTPSANPTVAPPSDLYPFKRVSECETCSVDTIVSMNGNEYVVTGLSSYGAATDLFDYSYGFKTHQTSISFNDADVIAYGATSSEQVYTDPSVMQRIVDDVVAKSTTGDLSISRGELTSRSEVSFEQYGNPFVTLQFHNEVWGDAYTVVKVIGPKIVLVTVSGPISVPGMEETLEGEVPEAEVFEQFQLIATSIRAGETSPTSWEDPDATD